MLIPIMLFLNACFVSLRFVRMFLSFFLECSVGHGGRDDEEGANGEEDTHTHTERERERERERSERGQSSKGKRAEGREEGGREGEGT